MFELLVIIEFIYIGTNQYQGGEDMKVFQTDEFHKIARNFNKCQLLLRFDFTALKSSWSIFLGDGSISENQEMPTYRNA